MQTSETPNLDKMLAVKEHSQTLTDFVDWLNAEGIFLASWFKDEYDREHLYTIYDSYEELFARFFDINLKEVDKERMQILNDLRNN